MTWHFFSDVAFLLLMMWHFLNRWTRVSEAIQRLKKKTHKATYSLSIFLSVELHNWDFLSKSSCSFLHLIYKDSKNPQSSAQISSTVAIIEKFHYLHDSLRLAFFRTKHQMLQDQTLLDKIGTCLIRKGEIRTLDQGKKIEPKPSTTQS